MRLKIGQEFILHSASLMFLVLFALAYRLALFVFLTALIIMAFNLWKIVHISLEASSAWLRTAQKSPSRLPQNIQKFQMNIKQAYKNAMLKQTAQVENQMSWQRPYFKHSASIDELHHTSLIDLRKDSVSSQQHYSAEHRLPSQKIRFWLLSPERQTEAVKQTVLASITAYFQTSLNTQFRLLKLQKDQIQRCYMVVDAYINSILEIEIQGIVTDLQSIQKRLSKFLGLTFTLQSSSSQNTINYNDLIELVTIIEKKGAVPPRFYRNASNLEIRQQIVIIKNQMSRVPDLRLSPCVLKLFVVLKHLQQDFPKEQMIFAGWEGEARVDCQRHLFRVQEDDRFFYHQYSSIKSRYSSTPVLLFLLHVLKKYVHSNISVIRDLKAQLEII